MRGFWDKVTIEWKFGDRPTAVRERGELAPEHCPSSSFAERANDFHGLFGMKAVSLPNEEEHSRRGEMTLDLRLYGPNRAPNKKALADILRKGLVAREDHSTFRYAPVVYEPQTESWVDTIFKLGFGLANGEQFCDTAIEIGRAVFESLGVEDKAGMVLANFTVDRDTFAKLDGNWVSFARWLRMIHRLPVWGPEDLRA